MRTRTLMSTLLGISAALAVPGCGSGDLSVLLSLSNVPATGKTLQVAAKLDQQALNSQAPATVPLPLEGNQLGVTVPRAGHLALDLRALDGDGCTRASAQPELDLSGRRSDLALSMSSQTPRRCGGFPVCTSTTSVCPISGAPVGQSVRSFWAVSPTDIWAVGSNASVMHYDGATWTITPAASLPVPATTTLKGVWASGPTDVWAVGSAGKILHFDGQAWTSSSSGATRDLEAISGVSKDHIWTVGRAPSATTQAEFWHWGGSAWSQINPPGVGDLYAVWAVDANFVVGGGGNGASPLLWVWDGNNMFQQYSSTVPVPVWGLWGASRTRVLAVGPVAQLLVFDGTSWKLTDVGYSTYDFYGVSSDGTNTFLVGTDGLVLRSTDPSVKPVSRITTGLGTGTGNVVYAASALPIGVALLGGDKAFLGSYDTRP